MEMQTLLESAVRRTPGPLRFGYRNTDDPAMMLPVPEELEMLRQAFGYLDRGFSARDVAAWLVTKSGRVYNHVSLFRRWRRVRARQASTAKPRLIDLQHGIIAPRHLEQMAELQLSAA